LGVDHAGEVGAIRIYQGQLAILKGTPAGNIIEQMNNKELEHLEKFNHLLNKHRVRPTVLSPIWDLAGYALGIGSAFLGKEAAMACTVAVENVIGEHYNDQVRTLLAQGDDVEVELRQTFKELRDDELEHKETAEQNEAAKAPFYNVLTTIIETGCKTAIWLSQKI